MTTSEEQRRNRIERAERSRRRAAEMKAEAEESRRRVAENREREQEEWNERADRMLVEVDNLAMAFVSAVSGLSEIGVKVDFSVFDSRLKYLRASGRPKFPGGRFVKFR